MRPVASLVVAVVSAAALSAQNCSRTSIGADALVDLGAGTYQGFTGGLYPGGSNARPAAHEAAAVALAGAIQPLDGAGNPSPTGRIVLLSIGMSNTTQEFSTWIPISNADPQRHGAVQLVDGAQGGQHAGIIANPNAQFWTVIDQRLTAAGVTREQVQVVWIKQAVARPTDPFPQHAQTLQGLLAEIVRIVRSRYRNCTLAFLSSRIYAGYATTTLNPEPYAYESGFAVKWLIDDQIAGRGNLNYDPARGAVVAPHMSFGPYLWADGLRPRGDGLVWECADFNADGTHPSPSGRTKVANMLNGFFRGDTATVPWYLGGGGGNRAAVLPYGSGCDGGRGALEVRHTGTPYLGNTGFGSQVGNAAPSCAAALLLAAAPARLPLAGACELLVDPRAGLLAMPTATSATGRAGMRVPIPAESGLGGQSAFTQWFVHDPQGTPWNGLGLSLAHGAEWRLGAQ